MNRLLGAESLDQWKAYLRWHMAHARAPYLLEGFRGRRLRFLSEDTARGHADRPRWKKCAASSIATWAKR